jgi:hypothetical protein
MDKKAYDPQFLSQDHQPLSSRCLMWSGYAILIWSAANGLLHFLWALGIGVSMLKPSALEIPQFKVANLAVAILLTAVGFLGLAFIHLRGRNYLSWWLLAVSLVGCSLSTSHGVYGVVNRILQIAGVVELESGPFGPIEHAYVLWDLFLIEPWFTIEGILFAIAGWCYLDSARSKRIWLLLCAVGVIVGLITGLVGIRIG